jgi:hypothetical protein
MRAATARLIERRTDLRGDENEAEMDHIYQQEALQIIKDHPGRYMLLSLYRFIPLWTNLAVRDEDMRFNKLFYVVGMENIILLTLGIAAALRGGGTQRRFLWPIIGLVAYFTLIHMLVNAKMRYIVPVMPYVMLCAAAQCIYLVTRLRGSTPLHTRSSPQEAQGMVR